MISIWFNYPEVNVHKNIHFICEYFSKEFIIVLLPLMGSTSNNVIKVGVKASFF